MRFASLLLSFLFAAFGVSAQVNPQCSIVSVNGPFGIPQRGEPIPFTTTVKPIESKLTFKWTVSSGTIAEGQGTSTIKVYVGPNDANLTVKVEVGGLPQECVNVASETVSDLVGNLPIAKKIETFSLPLSSVSDKRFQDIADTVDHDPTSQLFIFIPADHIVRDALTKRLYRAIHDFDPLEDHLRRNSHRG